MLSPIASCGTSAASQVRAVRPSSLEGAEWVEDSGDLIPGSRVLQRDGAVYGFASPTPDGRYRACVVQLPVRREHGALPAVLWDHVVPTLERAQSIVETKAHVLRSVVANKSRRQVPKGPQTGFRAPIRPAWGGGVRGGAA